MKKAMRFGEKLARERGWRDPKMAPNQEPGALDAMRQWIEKENLRLALPKETEGRHDRFSADADLASRSRPSSAFRSAVAVGGNILSATVRPSFRSSAR